jgi:iron complex transport system substrate-binding protein
MKKNIFLWLSAFCLMVVWQSCTAEKTQNEQKTAKKTANLAATNFDLSDWDAAGAMLLTIYTPWVGSQTPQKYLLCPRERLAELQNVPENLQIIATPVRRIVCTSTIQAAMLHLLGATDNIAAMSDGKYIYNSAIMSRLEQNKIVDLGNDQVIDYERLLATSPQLVLVFGLAAPAKMCNKLDELAIPNMYIAEYIEPTPLGRAEWICVIGALLGKTAEARAIFEQNIYAPYQKLRLLANQQAQNKPKPTVFTGVAYEGTWYVAGGRNFLATLIADAGGKYIFDADTSASSVALSFEYVYANAQKADIWLNVSQAKTKNELLGMDSRYADFEAFRQGKIYSYHKRVSANGGFDVFESAVVQPHLLLQDFMQIFYADSLQNDSLYYYLPLESSK